MLSALWVGSSIFRNIIRPPLLRQFPLELQACPILEVHWTRFITTRVWNILFQESSRPLQDKTIRGNLIAIPRLVPTEIKVLSVSSMWKLVCIAGLPSTKSIHAQIHEFQCSSYGLPNQLTQNPLAKTLPPRDHRALGWDREPVLELILFPWPCWLKCVPISLDKSQSEMDGRWSIQAQSHEPPCKLIQNLLTKTLSPRDHRALDRGWEPVLKLILHPRCFIEMLLHFVRQKSHKLDGDERWSIQTQN